MTESIPSSLDVLVSLRERIAMSQAGATDWLVLGRALLLDARNDKGRQREALTALVQAYQLDPCCDATLLHVIAHTAFVVRDWAVINSVIDVLLACDVTDANVLVWCAAAVQQRNDFGEAECLLREAMRLAPNNPFVLHQLALCIQEQARFPEAQTLLRQVLQLSPGNALARFDLSELELRAGHYAEGWGLYEARIELDDDQCNPQWMLTTSGQYWQGESLTDKTLVIYGEQGNGDCLWALHFLPRMVERAQGEGGRVMLSQEGTLRPLVERMQTMVPLLESRAETQPDFYCGLMSLPLRLGIVDSTGWGGIYLSADVHGADAWRSRIASMVTATRLKVGLVWSGNLHRARDMRRSIPVEQLGPLLTVKGITFFVLSPGHSATVERWRAQDVDIIDLTCHFVVGFDDVASLMVNLDLVVTIDSGPAHLAGALGVPTYLLIDYASAWYWGDQVSRAPWYDSVELFPQPALGAWTGVLASVRERLESLAAAKLLRRP